MHYPHNSQGDYLATDLIGLFTGGRGRARRNVYGLYLLKCWPIKLRDMKRFSLESGSLFFFVARGLKIHSSVEISGLLERDRPVHSFVKASSFRGRKLL